MWRKEDIIKALRKRQGESSYRTYASSIGCSASYLHALYNGQREPNQTILDHLGLVESKREVIYTEKPKRRWR